MFREKIELEGNCLFNSGCLIDEENFKFILRFKIKYMFLYEWLDFFSSIVNVFFCVLNICSRWVFWYLLIKEKVGKICNCNDFVWVDCFDVIVVFFL